MLETSIAIKIKKIESLKKEIENKSKEITEKQTVLEALINLIKDNKEEKGKQNLSTFLKEEMNALPL